jgi:2-hydroxy-3-keto-5-methylthiopentenyl-1-phosphate phosphatase
VKPAVLTDFDDTAAYQNVAELLLDRFGAPSWHRIRQRFRDGELTFKDYQEMTFRTVQVGRDTMQAYVKENARLRPHFGELWRHCQAQGIPMVIVSVGLDFYIQALLDQEGYSDIPVYSVDTSFTSQGIDYHYRYTRPEELHLGISKAMVVDSYRERGHHVIFIGDGRSDFGAATRADTVFAHSVLAEECQRQQIPYRPFTDFGDVLRTLREGPSLDTNGDSSKVD